MRENGEAKNGLKTIDSWKNGVFCPWHFARKFSWEVCGFREWETIKLIATINLLPQNIKFPCHYTFIPHLAPGSKLFSESLKSINQFMNLYVWVYCKLEKLNMNNLISHYGIYWRFRLGDTFLLKSNRIRMFNTTCKTGKTLWIIHFRFYLSRKSNYLNCSKYGVQWWTDQGGAAGYNLVYRATPRLLPSHYWN